MRKPLVFDDVRDKKPRARHLGSRMIILDTNLISEPLHQAPDPRVTAWIVRETAWKPYTFQPSVAANCELASLTAPVASAAAVWRKALSTRFCR